MIKGSIQEEGKTIICASKLRTPQDVRQMLISMKGEINSNTIIVRDFLIPHSHLQIYQPNRKLARKHKL